MNRVDLIGRLTKDIEIRYTQNQVPVASFNLAVNRKFKNQNGEYETDFINCIAFNKTADLLKQYTKKGDLIATEGRIQTRNYEKDGKKVYITEIVVESIEFLQKKEPNNDENSFVTIEDTDDLPF